MEEKTKTCPYCKEKIKIDAVKCKHCQADLNKKHQTWKPVALGCIFAFSGIVNLLLSIYGSSYLYGVEIGEIGIILILIFGFILLSVSWGFFKRKSWAVSWGYGTGILSIIVGLITVNWILIIFWSFVLYLTHTSKTEMVN